MADLVRLHAHRQNNLQCLVTTLYVNVTSRILLL